MFKFHDLQKECCLTCQFFKAKRKVEVIGQGTFIDHDGNGGCCKVYNNFKYPYNQPAKITSFCQYKRWIELP